VDKDPQLTLLIKKKKKKKKGSIADPTYKKEKEKRDL
jgi:hypothetical protein